MTMFRSLFAAPLMSGQRPPLKACFGILVFSLVLMVGAGCSRQARTNRYLARAERDFHAEQYDRAEIEYLSALQLTPLEPNAT